MNIYSRLTCLSLYSCGLIQMCDHSSAEQAEISCTARSRNVRPTWERGRRQSLWHKQTTCRQPADNRQTTGKQPANNLETGRHQVNNLRRRSPTPSSHPWSHLHPPHLKTGLTLYSADPESVSNDVWLSFNIGKVHSCFLHWLLQHRKGVVVTSRCSDTDS